VAYKGVIKNNKRKKAFIPVLGKRLQEKDRLKLSESKRKKVDYKEI